ncbi:hypothetical protein B0H94_1058 [Salsuginibacillus halophilus]|uniref:Uncharacterized protein n=1 Tax=Salsuginibacillus halophilus TaxID=517424 RepID=A0A2P8HKV7_9BACI|nr:hypothetical protein [Salsuginibacillus halophilus]PSL46858.1 hypothetical protein B0H94_1058 [Salsuginibacillus halophilus]
MTDKCTLKVDRHAKSFIMNNGGIVTLDPYTPWDVTISCSPPPDFTFYRAFEQDGITCYIQKDLIPKETIHFHTTGFGPFEHLQVRGVKPQKKDKKAENDALK